MHCFVLNTKYQFPSIISYITFKITSINHGFTSSLLSSLNYPYMINVPKLTQFHYNSLFYGNLSFNLLG